MTSVYECSANAGLTRSMSGRVAFAELARPRARALSHTFDEHAFGIHDIWRKSLYKRQKTGFIYFNLHIS